MISVPVYNQIIRKSGYFNIFNDHVPLGLPVYESEIGFSLIYQPRTEL